MTISAVRAGSSMLLSALFSITLLAGCSSSDGGSDPVGGNPTDPTDPNTPDPIGDVEPGTPTTKTVMVGDDERSFVIYAPSSSSNKSYMDSSRNRAVEDT